MQVIQEGESVFLLSLDMFLDPFLQPILQITFNLKSLIDNQIYYKAIRIIHIVLNLSLFQHNDIGVGTNDRHTAGWCFSNFFPIGLSPIESTDLVLDQTCERVIYLFSINKIVFVPGQDLVQCGCLSTCYTLCLNRVWPNMWSDSTVKGHNHRV